MKKMNDPGGPVMKPLAELTLLDRFLFACVMEDRGTMELVLSIILGEEIRLAGQPQAEREMRTVPWLRSIRLDVYSVDEENRVYNAEVQKKNTGNLIKRSRFYQALIDSSLLAPGEIDFNRMQSSCLITIMPFDLWGYGRYRYTFRMVCQEESGLFLEDGAVRIFLNTHGTVPEGVSGELIELLHYIEHTSETEAAGSSSPRIKELHRRVSQVKASEEIGVRYMQEWEERMYQLQDAKAEGREEGREAGLEEGIRAFVLDNLEEGKTEGQILDKLVRMFSLSRDTAGEYLKRYKGTP